MTLTRRVLVSLLLITPFLLSMACEDESTRPKGPCYMVSDLFSTNSAVGDTVAARAAFEAYLDHLDEAGGYPVFHWSSLQYLRSAGTESYQKQTYWGVIARGVHVEGDTLETQMYRVRQDGMVVGMLGCI
jgi:hypothetical protein